MRLFHKAPIACTSLLAVSLVTGLSAQTANDTNNPNNSSNSANTDTYARHYEDTGRHGGGFNWGWLGLTGLIGLLGLRHGTSTVYNDQRGGETNRVR